MTDGTNPDKPVNGPLHHEVECPCYRDACTFIEVTDHIRWGLHARFKYCWWVELQSGDRLSDLKRAREAINKAIGEEEAKKYHLALTPRPDHFFP
jgi:hypothetical protein